MTTSAYVPFGLLVSAFAEYQTVVVSFKAFVAVVLNTWSDAVIPVHVVELEAAFVITEYVVSKLFAPIPVVVSATAQPHVLLASAAPAANVLLLAAMVLPPFVSVSVASASLIARLYPFDLFVLTVTVSLALV